MDNPLHEGADSSTHSTPYNPELYSQGSGMFTGSENFTVTGGTFTNITNHPTVSVPSDFRMIPMGDIDLRHEIQVDRSTGVVGRQREQTCMRRIYAAKVEGQKSNCTVAMYQGNGAEQEWRRNIAKYTAFRHPNIVQIYGTATTGGIHATIFYDDLVPFRQYADSYRNSPLATVYIYACCTLDYIAADNYVHSTFQSTLNWFEYTAWIRRSSGQLCAELIPPSDEPLFVSASRAGTAHLQRMYSPSPLNAEATVIESLTTEVYHNICFHNLSQYRRISISTSTTVKRGAIISCSSDYPLEDPVEIAYTPNVEPCDCGWETYGRAKGAVMEDGWTRLKSDDIFNGIITLDIWNPTYHGHWLSQANTIFRRLRITSNFEDYVLVDRVFFILDVFRTTNDPPAGFLFVCPGENFKTGPSSLCWPDCPAYWSLDPSGVDRLTLDEATRLGFPLFRCTTEVSGSSWDASVYEGLCKFHQAKGFDPDTRDLARHLGHSLYQLSSLANSHEIHPLSGTYKFLTNIKFTLILFLGLSWVYEHM